MTSLIMDAANKSDLTTTMAYEDGLGNSSSAMDQDQSQGDVLFNTLSVNDQDMIVNVTREYPFDYAMVMFGYIMPFVLVLTLATNTLVVIVLAQKHMRTPTNIVLFTMAIVDLMTLLSPSPWYFYIYTLGYHDKFLYPPTACYAHHIMTDVIPVFFHTSSIWLALLLASQRYIYVCHPTLARTWCTVPRVRRAIVIILVTAFLHQLTKFFDNNFVAVTILVDKVAQPACKIEIADWVHSIDIAFYYTTYFTFRILFVFIIPCTALITLNYLLFRALRRAESKRTELLKTRFKLIRNSRLINELAPRNPSLNSNIVANHNDAVDNELTGRASKKKRRTTLCNKTEQNGTAYMLIEAAAAATATADNSQQNGSKRIIKQQSVDEKQLVGAGLLKATEEAAKGGSGRAANSGGDSSATCFLRKSDEDEETAAIDEHTNEAHIGRSVDTGGGSEDNGDDDGDDDDDDESTCPECADYKGHENSCRRCSAATDDGATCDRADNYHHGLSQCSSLIGGATNTTTNEDMSSCAVTTHHASSSMFVAQDGADDPLESGSVRGEGGHTSDGCMEQENLSLQNTRDCNNAKLGPDLLQASGNDAKLTKSGSVDSRLVCGCLLGARSRSSKHFRPLRSIRRTANMYKESCLSSGICRSQQRSNQKNSFLGSYKSNRSNRRVTCCNADRSKCLRACSSSDPCIHCDNNEHEICQLDSTDRTDSFVCHAQSSGNKCMAKSYVERSNAKETDNKSDVMRMNDKDDDDDDDEDNANRPGERSKADFRSARMFSSNDRVPTTTTTATTTTTNLYSANTNSSGSLPQALSLSTGNTQQQKATGHTNESKCNNSNSGRKSVFQMQAASSQAKNPSYTGSISGCGANRANVSGTTTTGTIALSGSQAVATTTSASVRTMDSNRTTLMLIVVVTVFLMVEVPVAIVTILHVVLNTFDVFKDVDFGLSLNYTKLLTNFFIMISYSVNFTIYCSMSKKFRDTFRDLFLCKKYKSSSSSFDMRANQSMYCQPSQYNPPNFNINLPSECNNTSAHLFGGRRATVTHNGASAINNSCKSSFTRRGRASTSAIASEASLNLQKQVHQAERKRCEL